VNTGRISKRVFWKNQHAYEEGHREAGMKQGFGKLKVTAGIGNTRNWLVWHV
jgi:hypothetical protein